MTKVMGVALGVVLSVASLVAAEQEVESKEQMYFFDLSKHTNQTGQIYFYMVPTGSEGAFQGHKVSYSWNVGTVFVLLQYAEGKSAVEWRKLLPEEKWRSLEKVFGTIAAQTFRSRSESPEAEPAEPPQERRVIDRGPLPGTITINVSSKNLLRLNEISAVLYAVSPNELTAIGAATTEGLVLLDTIGGNSGFQVIKALPFPQLTVIVPNDPKKFGENALKLLVDPRKQAELLTQTPTSLVQVGKTIVKSIPTKPKEIAATIVLGPVAVLKPSVADDLKEAVRKPKDVPKRLGKVAKKAVKDIGKVFGF